MSENGIKHDSGKLRYSLIPPEAIEAMAEVFTYGASKYPDNNWKKVEYSRYVDALNRHLMAHAKGELRDKDSNLHHLKHALTNVAIMLYKVLEQEKQPEFTSMSGILIYTPEIKNSAQEIVDQIHTLEKNIANLKIKLDKLKS